ncbi:MAG: hypothetical protein HOE30_22295 [Deltaproteobacteria bacterium]|jgi:hypothetical protein|nr:hypothetical protein [Deltaproteobacteria bacterium]
MEANGPGGRKSQFGCTWSSTAKLSIYQVGKTWLTELITGGPPVVLDLQGSFRLLSGQSSKTLQPDNPNRRAAMSNNLNPRFLKAIILIIY